MLGVCGQLFSDCWPFLAFLLGCAVAFAIYELLTKSHEADEEE
jgi:hypothetical protein